MKRFVLALLGVIAALVIIAIAFVVRVKHNFEEMNEAEINEMDYVYFMYDGSSYTLEEAVTEALSGNWEEDRFAVCLDYAFEDGDIFSAKLDNSGTKFYYTIFGVRVDITKLMHSETELDSQTIFENIESF